jgi:hypothetical protein
MVVFEGMKTLRVLRPALVPLTLGAALLTGACGTAGTPGPTTSAPKASGTGSTVPAGSEQSVTEGDVRLEVSASVGFSTSPTDPGVSPTDSGVRRMPGLVVEYTLTNTGASDLVAYDVVPDTLGSGVLPEGVDPEHAWVYVDQGDVRVSKQAFAPAPGITFIAAPTTGVRALPPGGSLTGRASVPTPLQRDVPGPDFSAPRDVVPAGADTFRFCVQVGERSAQMRPSRVGADVLEAPLVAPTGDDLVCTDPVRVPVA